MTKPTDTTGYTYFSIYRAHAVYHNPKAEKYIYGAGKADGPITVFDVGFDEIVSGSEEGIGLHGFTYDVTTAVQTVQSDPGTGYAYKQVAVLIEWTVGGKEDDLTVVTYISNVSGGA